MRRPSTIAWPALAACALAACATTGGSGSSSPFPGGDAVTARIKAINDAASVATPCSKSKTASDKGGMLEVTANPDGRIVARTLTWEGSPAIAACIVDAAQKTTLPPLAGAPVSTVWQFRAGEFPKLAPPDGAVVATELNSLKSHLTPEVEACAQRNLAPDFPADIELLFVVVPGGKIAATTVTLSGALDGNFDRCVQQAVGAQGFRELHYDGPYPLKLKFHVGHGDKL